MKIVFLLNLLFICSYTINAQAFSNWYFGQNAGVGFNSNPPLPHTGNAMNTPEGCATFSSGLGNVLYYSNGRTLWNGTNQVMSADLNGNIYAAQSALFVGEIPESQYIYLFTVDADAGAKGLQYTILQNVPSPHIVFKNLPIKSNVTERVCAIRHCNRKSYWILSHGWNSNEFYAYHLTKDTFINPIPVVTKIGSIHNGSLTNATGYMKCSEDGSFVALAKTGSNQVELFRFDNLNGVLYDSIVIPGIQNAYGIEFSPNNLFLYVTSISGAIHQYDIQNYNQQSIIASKEIIYSSNNLLGALQIAENQKIYVAIDNHNYLGCIVDPMNSGSLCNFNPDAVYLLGKRSEAGLPPRYQKAEDIYIKLNTPCEGDTTFFEIQNIDSNDVDSVFWNFDDPTTFGDTSKIFNPYYVYPYYGSFHPYCIIYYCNEIDTIKKDAIVLGPPFADLGPDTSFCSNASLSFNFSNGQTYLWQNGSTSSSMTISDTGLYWVQVTNPCATRTDSMYVKEIWPVPIVQLPNDSTLCDGDSLLLFAGNDSLLTYIWNYNDTNQTFIVKQSGQYVLQAIDSNKCSASDQITIQYLSPPQPNLGNDTTLCKGEAITFNGGPGDTYLWSNLITNPSIVVSDSGQYYITVWNKCGQNTDSVNVKIDDCEQKLWVPTAFTPNNDGLNEVFKPVLLNVTEFSMSIYNRYGERIFFTEDINYGWDGKLNSKNCGMDVYTWIIKYKDFDNAEYIKYGYVALIR